MATGWMRRRRRFLVVMALGVAVVGAGVIAAARDPSRFVRHVPVRHGDGFDTILARADRLVVSDGRFNCCGHDDPGPVLAEITDPAVLRRLAATLRFENGVSLNSFDDSCMCCGNPRLDWYRGSRRIALTALDHGRSLRWKGFTTASILGVRVGYGDAPLTETSARQLGDVLSAATKRSFRVTAVRPLSWRLLEGAPVASCSPQDQARADDLALRMQVNRSSTDLRGALIDLLPESERDASHGSNGMRSWALAELSASIVAGNGSDRQWAAACELSERSAWWLQRGAAAFELLASPDSDLVARALAGDPCAERLAWRALESMRAAPRVVWSCCDESDRSEAKRLQFAYDDLRTRLDAAVPEAVRLRAHVESVRRSLDAWIAECDGACP
jgi:hypothetical protein